MALEYAAPELREDRRLVTKALSRDGCALQFAAPELRNDLEAGRSGAQGFRGAARLMAFRPIHDLYPSYVYLCISI